MSSKPEFPLIAKVINGSIAGIVGITSCFPLDLVKTRLQNQRIGPNGEKTYSSILDCFKKVYQAEGLRGMYRGVGVTVLLATPEKMVKLTANDVFRYHLREKDGSLSIFRQGLAGGLAGAFQMLISSPLELFKINMQLSSKAQDKSTQSTTARSLLRDIIREKGLLGVYRGLGPTAARDITFSVIYFPLFSLFDDMGPRRPDGTAVAWCSLLAGFAAGAIAAVSVTPMDVVKTRIQASSCSSILSCTRETYSKEGLGAFFKGGLCRIMVLAPLLGIAQCFYFLGIGEAIVRFFRGQKS